MIFSDIAKKAQKFTIDNSPMLLTVVGAAGTVATAYLTGRAAFKAAGVLREAGLKKALRGEVSMRVDDLEPSTFTLKEQVNLTWKLYIPAFTVGTVTLASIVGANRIGTKRTAALAAAYTLSQTAFDEYKTKAIQKLGEKKALQITEDIGQDRLNANPIGSREVIITGNGDVDCYDCYSGRYFKSNAEEIRSAENRVNALINNNFYASLNEFYDYVGLPRINAGDEVGWSSDKGLMTVTITGGVTTENKPCLNVDFSVSPVRNYFRHG